MIVPFLADEKSVHFGGATVCMSEKHHYLFGVRYTGHGDLPHLQEYFASSICSIHMSHVFEGMCGSSVL